MQSLTSEDVEEVESALDVLDHIVNQRETDEKEQKLTPIMVAIQKGNGEDLLELLLDPTDLEERDEEGNTAVLWAIKKNTPIYLKMLMNKQASPNVLNSEGAFAIHKAVDSGNDELVEILCQCGADVNVVDSNGQTAVHYAVYYGSIPILMTLIKYNVDVNIVDQKGRTALFIAVWKGNTDIIRLLLENNADTNTRTEVNFHQHFNSELEEVTPAMYAAATGYVRGLELLLNFGADPHMRENTHKRSALFYASLYNHKPCVDIILRETNLDKILIEACNKGHLDYAKLLLEFKPDLEATDDLGETALSKSAKHEDIEMLNILLEAGASVDPVLGNKNSKSPLMSAAVWGRVEQIRILLNRNACVNKINGNKETALWFAAENGNLKCVEMLLEAGAPPNLASCRGTPLMAATQSLGCLKALLKHGCELNYTNDEGDCAVTLAATRWSSEYTELLIEHKANIHVADGKGWSPVMLATSKKKYSILKVLLDNGAQINHADNTGLTALHLAAQKDFISCMELLLSYNPDLNPIMRKTKRCMSWTPLTCAIKRGSRPCLVLLLKHGARASVPNSAGLRTTMTRAFTPLMIKALHAAGADPDFLPDLVHQGGDTRRNLPRWQLRHQQPNYPTDIHDQDHDKSLFNECRLSIRDHLLRVQSKNLFHTVSLLPLPSLVKSSLLFDVDLEEL